jgi:alkyl hydroperoxide reductase subunit AhpC
MHIIKKLCWLFIFIFSGTINALQIGDKAPNFVAQSTKGEINFYEWSDNKWTILFSHPGDFTPICTTELAELAFLQPEFKKRQTKIITLSADSLDDHLEWVSHINKYKNLIRTDKKGTITIGLERPDLDYPILADKQLKIATTYGMYHPKAEPSKGVFGDTNKSTIRSVFIIDPGKKIQTILSYPKHIGRNFNEIIRIIDALQLAKKYDVTIPGNWQKGRQVVVPTHVPSEDIKEKYNVDYFINYQDYLRTIDDPSEVEETMSSNAKKKELISFSFLPDFKLNHKKPKSKKIKKNQ